MCDLNQLGSALGNATPQAAVIYKNKLGKMA